VLSKAEAGYREPDNRYPCVLCRHFEAYLGRAPWLREPFARSLPATTGALSRTRAPDAATSQA